MARTTRGRVYKRDKAGREIRRGKERTTPGKWYAEYYHEGKRHRLSLDKKQDQRVTTREKAEEALTLLVNPYTAKGEVERTRRAYSAITAAQEAAEAARAERERVPLSEVWKRFPLTETVRGRRRRTLSPEVIEDNRRCWDKFVSSLETNYPDLTYMQDLVHHHGEEYSRFLRKDRGLSAHRHNAVIQTLRNICNLADMTGEANPFSSVSMYAVESTSREPLTVDELLRVCRSASGELRTLLGLGVFTGLRLGDCVQLRWDDVDLPANVIKKKASKSAKLSVIPLHPDLRLLLEETPPDQRRGYVLPGLAERYRRSRPSVSRLVGEHLRKQGIATTGDAGKNQKLAKRIRGFQSLRASVASLAVRAGASAEQVAQLLGHTKQVSREHYIQLGTEAARKVIEALPSGLLGPGTGATQTPTATSRPNALGGEQAAKMQSILQKMTARNWKKRRDQALELLAGCVPAGD